MDPVPGSPHATATIRLNLDPGTLSLNQTTGGWTGKVEETFVEVNETGATLSKVSDTKEFAVSLANRATMPGATKITVVVRDSKTGHVGSLTVPLPLRQN